MGWRCGRQSPDHAEDRSAPPLGTTRTRTPVSVQPIDTERRRFPPTAGQVNGRKTNIPSFQVKPNDVIEVREKSRQNPAILGARDTTAHAPTPNWLEVDKENLRARVLAQPKREELVQIQINEQLIVELYSNLSKA